MENCEMCQMKKMLAHIPKVPHPRGYEDGDQSAEQPVAHAGQTYWDNAVWDYYNTNSMNLESLERDLRRMQDDQERRTRDAERQLRTMRGQYIWERLIRSPGEPRRAV